MKASILKGISRWKYVNIKKPVKFGKYKAIVKITLTGICSTDVLRSMKTGFYSYPIVPGHEMIGIIEAIGKNNSLKIGDRVAVYPLISCGKCVYCKKKNPNLCDDYDFLGSRSNGGYAEYVLAPVKNLIKIPSNVPNKKAVFTEPLSVALHAFRISEKNFKPKKILILGLGPIGLLIALWAKYKKIDYVVGIDRNLNRLKIFNKIGYKKFIDTSKKNFRKKINLYDNFDTIFECSGSSQLQIIGLNNIDKKGQFIILSNPSDNLLLNKKIFSKILRNEINIKGSWSSLIEPYNEWKKTLSIINLKLIDPSILISNYIYIKDLPKKIERMYKKKFPFVKVIVKGN